MKQRYTILITLTLFIGTLYFAFLQGQWAGSQIPNEGTLSNMIPTSLGMVSALFSQIFNVLMNSLTIFFGGSVFVSLIVLGLIVELILLYPSMQLQLKQKKLHLFHKKLVNRFEAGELSFSKVNQEMEVLYSVNQKIHTRGALLVMIQIVVFLSVFWGLQSFAASTGARSLLDSMLLYKPSTFLIPLLAGVVYFSHSLIKISIKQKEDYIHPKQTQLAFLIALIASGIVFVTSLSFSVLLSVYFVTLISLGTIRYLMVEKYTSKLNGKIRISLINMLKRAETHKSSLGKWSQKWHHKKAVRHLNFHLLEEALSMSFVFMLMINTF